MISAMIDSTHVSAGNGLAIGELSTTTAAMMAIDLKKVFDTTEALIQSLHACLLFFEFAAP